MIDDALTVSASDLLSQAAERFRGTRDTGAYAENADALAFVASEAGDVTGWCWGYVLPRPDGTLMGNLHELEVLEGHRRQGIGRRLMEAFMEAAAARGAVKMFLTTGAQNEPARALYDSLGGALAAQGPTVQYWFTLPRSETSPSLPGSIATIF